MTKHIPVMLSEALKSLQPQSNKNFIDCNLGAGGYTFAIAKQILPNGKVLSIDLDPEAHKNAKARMKKEGIANIVLVKDNFANIEKISEKKLKKVDGIVFDLGLSSAQLDDEKRGFSFKGDRPLRMSFGQSSSQDADELVNKASEKELMDIFYRYGEEKFSRRIAIAIVEQRKIKPIKTTDELAQIIIDAVPARYAKTSKIHPATRIFQALRIAVNDELGSLEVALVGALNVLQQGGVIVVVSYHSLEDRIVKHFFKQEARNCLCSFFAPKRKIKMSKKLPIFAKSEATKAERTSLQIICNCGHNAKLKILTKKPISPSDEEIKQNPRSRSAKLRVAQKI